MHGATRAPSEAPFGPAELRSALGLSAEMIYDLERFRLLLADWSTRMNLVGPSALSEFWRRHVLDSAQLLVIEPDARTWLDLGSGAGFPGLVLAILLKRRLGRRVELVEALEKRCAFLREAARALELPARIHHGRAEALTVAELDVVTARAVAPLDRLLNIAAPHMGPGVVGLFLKGARVESELTRARETWNFQSRLTPSLSDPAGRVLRIWSLSPAPDPPAPVARAPGPHVRPRPRRR